MEAEFTENYRSWLGPTYKLLCHQRGISEAELARESGLARSTIQLALSVGPRTVRTQDQLEDAIDRLTAAKGGFHSATGTTPEGLALEASERDRVLVRHLLTSPPADIVERGTKLG